MRIEVKNYGGKITRRVDLPDRGLVLVTAPNGAGKTSLLADAPLYACFGWTGSRGDPLRQGGEVDFELGDLRVRRTRARAGVPVKVQIWLAGQPVDCDTETKADAFLAEHLGPAELWAQLLCFRWDAGSAYSCGTDSERKAQTEFLVPTLAGFDPARDKVGGRQKVLFSGPLRQVQQQLALAEQAEQRARAELERIRAIPESADDPEALRAELAPLEKRIAALSQRTQALEVELRTPRVDPELQASEQRLRDANFREQEARQQLARCGDGTCPTCRRPLGDQEEARRAREEIAAKAAAAAKELTTLGMEHRALAQRVSADRQGFEAGTRAELAALREIQDSLSAKISGLDRRIAQAEERQRLGATLPAAEERLAQAQRDLEAARAELAAQELERQALELADRMLGPRGARAPLLARAFSVVERLADERLQRAWPGWRLRIDRTSETAAGKVREVSKVLGQRPATKDHPADPEAIEVGAYSRGQLRRVDLPLLLARRQVLAAADHNRLALPYLAIDESLDGLDEEGITGCTDLLVEEARNNLVVVCSHDERIRRGVPFDRCIDL